VKLEFEDDFNELEGRNNMGGGENREGEAGDRLLRAQALIERPLKTFANCVTVRCEVGSISGHTQYVQDGPGL